MTVIVKKLGGSVAVVIPRAIAREMGLADGTSLDLTSTNDAIVMRRRGRRERRPINSIVNQIKRSHYRRRQREEMEVDAVGKEI